MTTPSKPNADSTSGLQEFLEGVCTADPFKVEKDFGHGYVRLRSTEAEKRQAAQDIKCTEDIVIELLRNSRDAGARNIFLATAKEGSVRTLTIIDDGCGIPPEMWRTIFEPRVTSKLETAHMDKWGMHGRGMALYSTMVNTESAQVIASGEGLGCSIQIQASGLLPEKTDQSTFPHFESVNGIMAMRGPKNIQRICCEFALEHRLDVTVYLGTPAQIASTLYQFGLATIPAYARAFSEDDACQLTKTLGLSHSPEDLALRAERIGLDLSKRTARRIMDGQVEGVQDLLTLLEDASLSTPSKPGRPSKSHATPQMPMATPRLQAQERDAFLGQVMAAYAEIADAYFLDATVEPTMHVRSDKIVLEIPLSSSDEAPGL